MRTRIFGLMAVLVMACMSGASAQTSEGEAATSVLTITCGLKNLPGSGSPLAGRPFVLWKQSFNDYLKQNQKLAAPPGAGANSTPLAAWAYASRTGKPTAQQALMDARPNFVTSTILDSEGRGVFPPIPPGTYYVFGQGTYEGRQIVWDAKVELRAGRSEFVLDATNNAPIDLEDKTSLTRTAPKPKPTAVAVTKPAGPRRPSGPKVCTLKVRVISGVDSPVGRTTFYLLDDNFETILKRVGYKGMMLFGEEQPLLNTFEVQARLIAMKSNPLFKLLESASGEAAIPPEGLAQFNLARKALAEHTVAVITTSSTGTGTFPRLPAGNYYVYGTTSQYVKDGYTGTVNGSTVTLNERGHQAGTIWNLKVSLKSGSQVVKLTPDNAVFTGD